MTREEIIQLVQETFFAYANWVDIGKAGFVPKKEWKSDAEYEHLDVVEYEGSLYIALEDNSNKNPVEYEDTVWMLAVEHGKFTEQQLEDFKRAVVAESKTEMDDYTDDKKDELDTYTGTKKTELDTYEETKESELVTVAENATTAFNTNATQKTTDYNDNATTKTTAFNTNATSKTETFDQNATTKTNAFDTNATEKTNTFNTNAESKTTDFNTNASTKTDTFNTNATDKTTAFNTNAESKTTDFNDNATEKLESYNQNAAEKIQEYNQNSATTDKAIELLAEEHFDTVTVEGENISVDDAEEFYGSINVKGRNWQATRSGKNYFNNATKGDNKILSWKIGNESASSGSVISDFLQISNFNTVYSNYKFYIFFYDISKNYIGNSEDLRKTEGTDYTNITVPDSENIAYFRLWYRDSRNSNTDMTTVTDIMITKTKAELEDYEEYGASPSPEFESPIKNLTGDIEVTANEETIVFPLAEGQRMCEGDYLADDGIHHARKQIILDGTETWAVYGSGNTNNYYCYWTSATEDMKLPETADGLTNSLCNYLKEVTWRSVYSAKTDESGIAIRYDNSRIYIKVPQSTVTELAEWLSNSNLVLEYPLAEEEVEPYTAEQQIAYNKLKKVLLQEGTNNITGTSDELNPILELTYQKIKEYTTEKHEDEQDSKIAELQNTVEELEENSLWNTTEQNTYIDVDDAAKYSKNKIAVVGRSYQNSRSGKNFFNKEKILNLAYGTVPSTSDTQIMRNVNYRGYYTNCSAGDIFSISRATTINNRFGVAFTEEKPEPGVICIQTTTQNDALKIENIVAPENANYIFIYLSNQADEIPDIQLEKNISATDYEEYGAMPSSEFPSAIQNVTGDVRFTDVNSNMWDGTYQNAYIGSTDGKTYITTNTNAKTAIIPCSHNTTYSIKKLEPSDSFFVADFPEFPTNNVSLNRLYSKNSDTEATVTTSADAKYLIIYVSTSTEQATPKLQVERGTILNDYATHAEHTVTFPLAEGQRLMEGDYLAEDGIHHVREQVVLDGNENWTFRRNGEIDGVMYYKYSTTLTNRYKSLAKFISTIGTNNQHSAAAQIVKNDKGLALYNSNNSSATVYLTTTLATVAELKSWLAENPVKLEYELEEETIEPYTTEQQQAWDELQNFMLYKGVNHITAESDELEPNMQLTYMQSNSILKEKEKSEIAELKNAIIELGGTINV